MPRRRYILAIIGLIGLISLVLGRSIFAGEDLLEQRLTEPDRGIEQLNKEEEQIIGGLTRQQEQIHQQLEAKGLSEAERRELEEELRRISDELLIMSTAMIQQLDELLRGKETLEQALEK